MKFFILRRTSLFYVELIVKLKFLQKGVLMRVSLKYKYFVPGPWAVKHSTFRMHSMLFLSFLIFHYTRWAESDLDEFLEEKERKKREKEEEEKRRPKRKYRRVQRTLNSNKGAAKTPAEAMEKMIKEKKLSTKVNG